MGKNYIYKIYTFNDDIDKEIIGYFDNLEDCIYIVETNYGDIQDAWYHYADIVEVPIGIYTYIGECKHHFYKWQDDKWNKLDEPPKIEQQDIQHIINKISSYGDKPWIDYGELPIDCLKKY